MLNNKVKTYSKKNYWSTGNLKREWIYICGTEFKLEKIYDWNGILHKEIPYKNNKINGLVKTFLKEEIYVDGVKNGKFLVYWSSDKICTIGNYVKGEERGVFIYFSLTSLVSEIVCISQIFNFESHGITFEFE